MIKPRNTFVILHLIVQAEKQHGNIVVPQNKECYTEAVVMAVGPGSVSAEGGRSETFDLKPGQRVWVKHKQRPQNPNQGLIDCGVPYTDDGVTYHGFEQSSILGIIAEPGEAPEIKPEAAKAANTPKLILND